MAPNSAVSHEIMSCSPALFLLIGTMGQSEENGVIWRNRINELELNCK